MPNCEWVVTPHGGGKTERMLRWAAGGNINEARVIVCFSSREAMRLLRDSRERKLGLESWQFVSYEEVSVAGFQSGTRRTRKVLLGIDNR